MSHNIRSVLGPQLWHLELLWLWLVTWGAPGCSMKMTLITIFNNFRSLNNRSFHLCCSITANKVLVICTTNSWFVCVFFCGLKLKAVLCLRLLCHSGPCEWRCAWGQQPCTHQQACHHSITFHCRKTTNLTLQRSFIFIRNRSWYKQQMRAKCQHKLPAYICMD